MTSKSTQRLTEDKHHPFLHHRTRRLHVILLLTAAFFCMGQNMSHIGLSLSCMCNNTALLKFDNISEDTSLLTTSLTSNDSQSCTKLQGKTVKDYGGTLVWSVKQQGYIVSTAFIGGFVMAYPGGLIVDKYSARHVLSFAMILLCVASLTMPVLATTVGQYGAMVVRFVQGIAEALIVPALNSVVTRWIPAHEKSTAAAIFTAGNQLTGIIGTPIVAELCASSIGWPGIFYLASIIGLVWTGIWNITVRNSPGNSRWIHEREVEYLEKHVPRRNSALEKKRTPWRGMLTSAAFWTIMFTSVFANMMLALVFYYIPVYFKDVLMLDVQSNGFYSMIPHVSNLFAKIAWGMWMDSLKRRKIITPTTAVKLSQVVANIGIAVSCFFLRSLDCSTPIAALILLSSVSSFTGLIVSGFYTSLLSIAPSHIGVLTSLSSMIGYIGRNLTPTLISYFKTTGTAEEWGNVLLVYASASAVCGAVFLLFGEGHVQEWDESRRRAKVALIEDQIKDMPLVKE